MIPAHAYNPSLCRVNGRLYLSFRDHDQKDWRTRLYIAELDEQLRPTNVRRIVTPESYNELAHEDARLFALGHELWMSWTIAKGPQSPKAVVAVGRLDLSSDSCRVLDDFIPRHGKNNWTAIEKNWCPIVLNGKLWFYYATKENKHSFIRVEIGGRVAEQVEGRSLPWNYGPIHGGALLARDDGSLLFFFNSRTGKLSVATHRYHIGVAALEGQPPFDMRAIAERPLFYGQEGYNLDRHKWFKANVVFCAGATTAADGVILMSYGHNDCKCRIAKLNEGDLLLK